MARLTPILKFYLPDIDDENDIYVKGFQDNFNILEDKLKDLLATHFVDVTNTNNTEKRAISDLQAHKWEGHRVSLSDDTTNNPITYTGYYELNPHRVTVSQLYVLESERIGGTGRLNSADDIIYNINNNLTPETTSFRHLLDFNKINMSQGNLSLIGDGIEDRLHSDLSFNILDETDSDTVKDKHLSNAQAKVWQDHTETIDKDTSNPHNVSAENLKSTENANTGGIAIQQAINSQGSADGINWVTINKTGSNLTELETRNHSDLQNISELDYTNIDIIKDKHVSNLDINNLYGHEYSKTTNEATILDIDNVGTADITYPTAKINPHEVRAKDLFSSDTAVNNHGADTIINEININGTSEGITNANTLDKIYWNLIDKDNIDGLGNGANINTIPNRSHQELQEILGATLTSDDTTQNKHISDVQTKKWEEHVDTIDKDTSNPHNVSSQSLKSATSDNTGGLAIQESINEQASDNGILWNKINKSGSNITELETRNHSSLQNIGELDSSDIDTIKDKHVSNSEAKIWQDHVLDADKSTSNPHEVSAQNLKSSVDSTVGGEAIQVAINAQGNDAGIDWNKINKTASNLTDLVSRNHSSLQNIQTLNSGDTDTTQDKHLSNSQAKKWEDHVDTVSGTNVHHVKAGNLYNGSGALTGGEAIVEAINTNATSESLYWSKIQKTGSNLTDLETANHDNLQNIGEATSTTDGTKNKHIADSDFKNWEDHRVHVGNPHNVTALQIGADNMLDTINGISTTSKINRNRINLVDSNLTEIEIRNHDNLQNIGIADLISSDTAQNKHISNANAKKWEDHVNLISQQNPHGTKASNVDINTITDITATNIQTALEELSIRVSNNSAGPLDTPGTFVVDATGVTFQTNDISLYHQSDFTGNLFVETVPEKYFVFADFEDLKLNYVYADYNISTGNMTYEVQSDISLINSSSQISCFLVFRRGDILQILKLSDYGNGTTEKILQKDYDFNRFEITNGLELQDDSTKQADGITPIDAHFKVKSGAIWSVLEKFTLEELSTKTTDLIWYYTENDGSWSNQTISAPIVWKVDTGNGVIDATNDYVANWIYRDVFTSDWYVVLGSNDYIGEADIGLSLGYAHAQPPVSLPPTIKEKTVLLGKVITKKNTVVNSAVYRTQGLLFTNTSTGYSPLTTHNSLDAIQGGQANEYYHMTTSQMNKLNSVEQNADVTDATNVGNVITSTIYGDTGANGVTITDIYNKALAGSDNNVKKVGDTMTGTLGIQKEDGCALAIGWDGANNANPSSDTWFRIGEAGYAFNHVYTGHEGGINNSYELWTTNNNASITDYKSYANGRVWRINQEGQINIYKELISSTRITAETLDVDTTAYITGQTKIYKGSADWKDTIIKEDASIELGKSGGGYAGSMKLWASSTDPHYSLIRMHHTDLFFDTLGKYYFNWDYTETPGEFYLGDGAQYNTIEETRANYLVLRSNDKSYFKNGLQVGTTSNTSGYVADFGGNINMNDHLISFMDKIHFKDGARLKGITNTTLELNLDSATQTNLRFSSGGLTPVTRGYVSSDNNTFGLKNKDNKWIITGDELHATKLYHDGIQKMNTLTNGVHISGILEASSTISEGGTVLSNKYLGKTAKASDSELLDGLNSTQFIRGDFLKNQPISDTNSANSNGVKFNYLMSSSPNKPLGVQDGALQTMSWGTPWSSQICYDWRTQKIYNRIQNNGSWSSWSTLYTTTFKPTKTDIGLSNIPNSTSNLINLNDENVLATSKAVKIAYDKAIEALSGSANAENAQKLDNLDSTQFIRSDVDDEATGIVNFSNAINTGGILLNSTDTNELTQKGLIIYDHSDSHAISAGLTHEGKITLGHSSDGKKTTSNSDTLLLHVGDIDSRNLIARENIIFSKSNEKKAEIKYDEGTGSLDFIFE